MVASFAFRCPVTGPLVSDPAELLGRQTARRCLAEKKSPAFCYSFLHQVQTAGRHRKAHWCQSGDGASRAAAGRRPSCRWQDQDQPRAPGAQPRMLLGQCFRGFVLSSRNSFVIPSSSHAPRTHVLRDFHLLNNCIYQVIIYSFSHFLN